MVCLLLRGHVVGGCPLAGLPRLLRTTTSDPFDAFGRLNGRACTVPFVVRATGRLIDLFFPEGVNVSVLISLLFGNVDFLSLQRYEQEGPLINVMTLF